MKSDIAQAVKRFRWQQWATLGAFLLVSGLTAYYLFHTVRHAKSFHHHRDEPIRAWMTVGYVAHTYHVPDRVLYEALGLPKDRYDKRPLREIARAQHRSMEQVRQALEAALVESGSPYVTPFPSPAAQSGGERKGAP
jgi:hypothetical protein